MVDLKSQITDFDGEYFIPWPEDYGISFQCGFIIQDLKNELADYFKPWVNISINLHRHLEQHTLREEVNKMPLLDHRQLQDREERILAYVILTFIANGYVWQDRPHNVAKVLPRQLAVPLFEVSTSLHLPPLVTYVSFILANWKFTDVKGDRKMITGFHPWDTMSCFVEVVVNMEITFAKALKPILLILDSVRREECNQLVISLENLAEIIIQIKDDFSRLHEKVNASDFFQYIRPFSEGWGIENGPLPDGLIYEGISEQPKSYVGATGAQTGIFQTLDIVLGIQHDRDTGNLLEKVKSYLLPSHQEFINALRRGPDVKHFVENCSSVEVKRAYNKAVTALQAFRTYHIGIACKYGSIESDDSLSILGLIKSGPVDFDISIHRSKSYIIQQKAKFNEISMAKIKVHKVDGGDIMPFLKMVRDDTQKSKTLIDQEITTNESC